MSYCMLVRYRAAPANLPDLERSLAIYERVLQMHRWLARPIARRRVGPDAIREVVP